MHLASFQLLGAWKDHPRIDTSFANGVRSANATEFLRTRVRWMLYLAELGLYPSAAFMEEIEHLVGQQSFARSHLHDFKSATGVNLNNNRAIFS